MKIVNIYRNINGTEMKSIDISLILKHIKNGRWQTQVNEIRDLINRNENEKASVLKKTLPAFTPSGTFNERRKSKTNYAYYK